MAAANYWFLPVFRSQLVWTKAEESSVLQETETNMERATLATQRQNYLSGKYLVRHTHVHFSHERSGLHVSISTPLPYSYCLLLPRRESIITPRMAVHGRGENTREHHVNNKSQHHKKQLQSVNSGLNFKKQRGKEEISRSWSSILLLEHVYYLVI